MRPMRSFGGSRRAGFDFARTVAVKLAIALVAVSVVAWATRLDAWVMLIPAAVFPGLRLWQPLTYGFYAGDPLGVLFGALIVWQMGSALEATWGSRRLLRFALGVTVLAGVLTVLLSFVSTGLRLAAYPGAFVMGGALWVAYGLSFGRAQVSFWGIPITGNIFAAIGAAFVLLNAARFGVASVVPEVFGLLFAFLYVRGYTPRVLWLRLQSSRLKRQLKGSRSRHLKIVDRDRNTPRDSDRFLH